MDPAELTVQVQGPDGEWLHAWSLSHGTAEQIYLLLRIVMAERLATTRESCPVFLDDVLVHCDAQRKKALLDVIHGVSRERQVVLFTQEDEVVEWVRTTLVEPDDRLVQLAIPT